MVIGLWQRLVLCVMNNVSQTSAAYIFYCTGYSRFPQNVAHHIQDDTVPYLKAKPHKNLNFHKAARMHAQNYM